VKMLQLERNLEGALRDREGTKVQYRWFVCIFLC